MFISLCTLMMEDSRFFSFIDLCGKSAMNLLQYLHVLHANFNTYFPLRRTEEMLGINDILKIITLGVSFTQ